MISFTSARGDQRLSILDYDEKKTNARYRAVVNEDKIAVLHLQSVETPKDSHQDVSQLSLCPGVLESEALQLLSQAPVSNSLVCVMFIIERLQAGIVYRARDCQLVLHQQHSSQVCGFCQERYPAFSLVKLRQYCILIGRELQSVEIFSYHKRSYYRRPLCCYTSSLMP